MGHRHKADPAPKIDAATPEATAQRGNASRHRLADAAAADSFSTVPQLLGPGAGRLPGPADAASDDDTPPWQWQCNIGADQEEGAAAEAVDNVDNSDTLLAASVFHCARLPAGGR